MQSGKLYADLFTYALQRFGVLVLGLYRLRDETELTFTGTNARYVLTYPAEDTPLHRTDLVYCLEPFRAEPDYYTRLEAEDAHLLRTRDSAAAVGESGLGDSQFSAQHSLPSGSTEALISSTIAPRRAI